MFGRIKSGCFVLVLAILLIVALGTEAQLNFSTGWGKRVPNPQTGNGGSAMCSSQGKPSLNQLLAIYNLLQNEAQKLLDCQKFTK
ncbi:hypertrehalosaemic prohormone-like [Neodiprion virginianus]|uniref:Hypertrehalosaemic prohormone n=1 Tax=Neodiprion lecontei TaxID=441921 RepID=A0A6J0CE72_NEOLC|nr:hypertrehalosaemic prohormone [Neodiprion lecontei]XP_046624120.1 hypertrehalosaemic prohormone-like [Neodiprion virginianus]